MTRLIAIDGTLYFPHGGRDFDLEGPAAWKGQKDEPSLLLHRYDAGDCDTIPWPMRSDFATEAQLKERLASALYDERETNDFFGDGDSVELPDGTRFPFDEVLSPDYDPSQKPR
jgi:hypothetical protein